MSSSKICMNGLCGAKMTPQWKRGWPMKAGGFATLCYSCGTAYEHVNYCERFHLNEPGWRECKFCEKPVHCGCVVSKYLHECLDLGGISCIKCIRARGTQALKPIQSYPHEIPNGFVPFSGTWHPSVMTNRMNGGATLDKGKLTHLNESIEKHHQSTSSIHQIRQQDENHNRLSSSPGGELGMGFPNSSSNNNNNNNNIKEMGPTIFPNTSSSLFPPPENGSRTDSGLNLKPRFDGMPPQLPSSLSYSLGKPSVIPNNSSGVELEKVPSFKQGQRSRLSFPKPNKSGVVRSQSNNKGVVLENRVARPPVEGRGRNQLLPRYWPKMTDQELLQISGDLNSDCTITPLFEKVLSASDAGRIGRLVLPKACAEAYFPTINQSEGLPIRIQDIKGKEWTFQFRFWPNNNSRMYVLEGVTPCIQNMQLQAGDTVIFSRLDPGEKLVIGCRKAAVSADTQETETPAPNGVTGGTSSGNGNLPTKNSEQEANGGVNQEKKKSRNIGSKNKRLVIHNEDAMELKVTWEEAHHLLRPSPTSKPTLSMIEDCEFEEYDEPPVFGKKTIFTEHASGTQEQWGQCDSCSRWRRLPPDVLLPSKWTCSDNRWDPDRCSCSAPDEISPRDLERIFKFGKDSKKRKLPEGGRAAEEPSGLDALATAAVLGEGIGGEVGESSAGPTTRHPRHRPGCTCIVCIQPPSGKGKHKPNCFCNVCLTVKRRFKTLMMRKKKRLSDREAEAVAHKSNGLPPPVAGDENVVEVEVMGEGSGKGLDLNLNCDPDKEDEMLMNANNNGSSGIVVAPEWRNVLKGLVPCSAPKGTSEVVEDCKPSPSVGPVETPVDETASAMDDLASLAAAEADAAVVEVEVKMEKVVEDGRS